MFLSINKVHGLGFFALRSLLFIAIALLTACGDDFPPEFNTGSPAFVEVVAGTSSGLRVSLNGETQLSLPFDSLWEDPGASIIGDGAETARLEISGEVNTAAPGEYKITYTAVPQEGDSVSITRTIVVLSPQYELTISAVGEGYIEVNDGVNLQTCQDTLCRYQFPENSNLVLTAFASPGYVFSEWDVCHNSSDNTCSLSLTKATLAALTFSSESPIEVNSDVIELTEEQILAITNYAKDSDVIIFKPNTDITGIEVGSIILSKGIYRGADHPENVEITFARRVRKIIKLPGTQIIINTVPVALKDIINSGTINVKAGLPASELPRVVLEKGGSNVEGKALPSARSTASGSYTLPVEVELTPGVKVIGSLSIGVGADYDLDFHFPADVHSARAIVRAAVSGTLSYEIQVAKEAKLFDLDLGTYSLPPVVVGPVLIRPVVKVSLTPKAIAEASISPFMTVGASGEVGVMYDHVRGWSNLGAMDLVGDGGVTGGAELKGRFAVEGLIDVAVTAEVYDIAGPKFDLGLGGGVEGLAVLPPKDDCVIEYGPYGKLGVDFGGGFSVLGAEYEYTAKLVDYKYPFGGKRCIEDTEPPSMVENIIAKTLNDESIEVSWETATDNVRISHYEVWRRSGVLSVTRRIEPEWAGTSLVDQKLAPETEYCYFVYAVDGNKNRSEEPSQMVCANTGLIDISPPSSPSFLEVEAASTRALGLTWGEAMDDQAVAAYIIREHLPSGRIFGLGRVKGDQLEFFAKGLNPDTEYCFSVIAQDDAGNQSEPTDVVCETTLPLESAGRTIYLGCVDWDYYVIEMLMDLDEFFDDRIELTGIGNDYDGSRLSYVISGDYIEATGEVNAEINWAFEDSSVKRVDGFSTNLDTADTGDVPLTKVVDNGGCYGEIRIVKN